MDNRKAIAEWEREFRKQRRLGPDDPVPVSLPSPVFEEDRARRLEEERYAAARMKARTIPSADVIQYAKVNGPRNEKYVVEGGKFRRNRAFNPRFDPTLGQAIVAPAIVGAAAGIAAPMLPLLLAAGPSALPRLLPRLLTLNRVRRGMSELEQNARRRGEQALADYWAELYPSDLAGEHVAPQRWGRKYPVLNGLIQSRANVLKPAGITRGQMAQLHHACDQHFSGGNLPKRTGQRGWSAKREGLQRFGPARWAWECTTPSIKAATAAGSGAVYYGMSKDR